MIRKIDDESESNFIYAIMKDSYDRKLLIGSIYETESCISIIAESILNDEFYGIYLDGYLQAFIQVKNAYGCLFLNHIVVKNSSKSNGYGKKLFEYYQSMAREEGACLALEVDSRNENAFAWYSSLGFKVYSVTYKSTVLKENFSNDLSSTQFDYFKCYEDIGYSKIRFEGATWSIGKPSDKTYVINYDKFPEHLIGALISVLDKKIILFSKNNFDFKGSNTWMSYIMKCN
ncbi:GNAT family N-acetyltransferase [Pseudoalteromonas sp. SWN166]|uniref:GNAT family N-acetyltransferase n=1 Tax=Pseudoalteromonas sp. SWN166 TaxID=2792061 RepID=UPI0018CC979D|nr:GNAT family N-acetyltransferase [Pseudoalteromonas sp. SWN166]MBH0038962.1 GNAT family N-acetyltransferase [Pseudoalteromonas sp. SWN166]